MSKNILSLCAFDVCPPRSGDALRVAAINGGLAALGWTVTQYVAFPSLSQRLLRGAPLVRSLAPGWREQQARGGALKPLAWLLNRLGLPPLAADLSPRAMLLEPALRALLAQADVVIAEHPWLFRAVFRAYARPGIRWVLDAHNIEYPLYAARGTRLPGGLLRLPATNRLHAMEAFAFHHADLALVVCNDDAAQARTRYGIPAESLVVAPNGVDCAARKPVPIAERQRRKRALGLGTEPMVLFVGANWPPNVEAARAVLRIATELADSPVQFVIAGSVGTAVAGDALPARVCLTGPVEDLQPWLEAADLALNPMRSGGGSNIKLLEYLACALPVISTPFGARGLGLMHDRHALIVPLSQFGAELRAAIDPRRRAALDRLGQAGRLAVEAQFDWGLIVRDIDIALASA